MQNNLLGIEKNVSLKNYTTFKIGGKAKYFFCVTNKENLIEALEFAKQKKIKVFILGGGSNLLVADKGFNGLVLKIDITSINFDKEKVVVGAGAGLSKMAHQCAEKGLSGIEWAYGIPSATIGGAIYGHAQAFEERISDIVESVEALDLKNLKFKNLNNNQCKFSLKGSIFKKNKNLIILSAVLKFKQKKQEEIKEKIENNLDYRKKHHPINFPSAGSVFINPKGKESAGILISKCGLAGKKIGGAQISEKHCNFIVNKGNAKAKDVVALIKLAQKKVKEKFNIKLETEIQLIGF